MSENLDLKIRSALRKRKMTMSQLAKEVGISNAYLSDILNGNRTGEKPQEHIKTIKYILGIREEVR